MAFKCRQCGACCRIKDGIVRLSDLEILSLSRYLQMSESEFIDRFTDVSPDRKCLVLKSAPDGACVFLDENNKCVVHSVKPAKCGSFPYEWTNKDSCLVCPVLMENDLISSGEVLGNG